eukprot:9779640-Alexandrium_andersonii.AAC.1
MVPVGQVELDVHALRQHPEVAVGVAPAARLHVLGDEGPHTRAAAPDRPVDVGRHAPAVRRQGGPPAASQ